MKKIFIAIVISMSFLLNSNYLGAQSTSPSDPGGSPESGTPLGGGAPIGDGTTVLMLLGIAYGGRKIFRLFNNNMQLEEKQTHF